MLRLYVRRWVRWLDGGFLGLQPISTEEKALMEELEGPQLKADMGRDRESECAKIIQKQACKPQHFDSSPSLAAALGVSGQGRLPVSLL